MTTALYTFDSTQNALWIESFCEMLVAQKQASKNTTEAYQRDILDFAKTLQLPLSQADRKHVLSYLAILHQKNLSKSTVSRRLAALKTFFAFMAEEGFCKTNPVQKIERPTKEKKLPTVLTKEEIETLIDSLANTPTPASIRLSTLLELLYSTGLRVTELVTLPLRALIFNPKTQDLNDTIHVIGKGNKERRVHLNPFAKEALKLYLTIRPSFLKRAGLTGERWLFPSNSKEGHLTRQRFGQQLKDQAIKAGLPPDLVHPHALRHAFATHLLQNGADLMVIQKLLGHADISSTQIYTHVLPHQLKALLEEHHPLSNNK